MPQKRKTINFSSDDVASASETLYNYYCRYSGKPALITNCNIERCPRRRTDGARIIDTTDHMVKLYTVEGGIKLLKRKSGKIERQYRLLLGKLPVAYRCEPDGASARFLYVMDSALTMLAPAGAPEARTPIPPCIVPTADGRGCTMKVEVIDATRNITAAIQKISADQVRVALPSKLGMVKANEELLELLSRTLQTRLKYVTVLSGEESKLKMIRVAETSAQQVFDALESASKGATYTFDRSLRS